MMSNYSRHYPRNKSNRRRISVELPTQPSPEYEYRMETTFGVDPDWNTRAPEETPRDISDAEAQYLNDLAHAEVDDLAFDAPDAFVIEGPAAADDLSGIAHGDGFVNVPPALLPYRMTPVEAAPPILTVSDPVNVFIGPNAYPGFVEQVRHDGRVWVSYFDRDFDLWVGRAVSVEAVELAQVQ